MRNCQRSRGARDNQMRAKGEDVLFGSNILLMAPLTQAASRRTTYSNPSLDMSVTYLLRPEPAPACEDSIVDAVVVGKTRRKL